MSEPSPRQERGPARTYADDRIEVAWEPRLCIHTRECVRRLGAVFDRHHSTSGGSRETEQNELAVTPATLPSGARAVTMVMPVANRPSASRRSRVSIASERLNALSSRAASAA